MKDLLVYIGNVISFCRVEATSQAFLTWACTEN